MFEICLKGGNCVEKEKVTLDEQLQKYIDKVNKIEKAISSLPNKAIQYTKN